MLDPKELAYAKKVQSLLDEEIARLTESDRELKRSVRERTRELMENDPFGALYAGTDEDQLYSASSELRSENERDVDAAREMLRKAETYKRMKKTPYFGRVDFTYAGEHAPESFYIGLSTLNDGDDFDAAVYDWRARSARFSTPARPVRLSMRHRRAGSTERSALSVNTPLRTAS